jgi:hypothetical protein
MSGRRASIIVVLDFCFLLKLPTQIEQEGLFLDAE